MFAPDPAEVTARRPRPRLRYDALVAQCTSFVETTGRLGDVVLMHPYVLHEVSQNHRGTARFVTNPPITYLLDGRQYILVATTDTLYAFALYQ